MSVQVVTIENDRDKMTTQGSFLRNLDSASVNLIPYQNRRRPSGLVVNQDRAHNFRMMHVESDVPNSARSGFFQIEVKQIAEEITSHNQHFITAPAAS
jgi:hypothetical protein